MRANMYMHHSLQRKRIFIMWPVVIFACIVLVFSEVEAVDFEENKLAAKKFEWNHDGGVCERSEMFLFLTPM
jgi:hypothetical protein